MPEGPTVFTAVRYPRAAVWSIGANVQETLGVHNNTFPLSFFVTAAIKKKNTTQRAHLVLFLVFGDTDEWSLL